MSNLISIQNNSYYFKSNAISVYPCAYRGVDADGKFFNPASRYTSEQNITSAVIGLIPNGTYISSVPTISITLSNNETMNKVDSGI